MFTDTGFSQLLDNASVLAFEGTSLTVVGLASYDVETGVVNMDYPFLYLSGGIKTIVKQVKLAKYRNLAVLALGGALFCTGLGLWFLGRFVQKTKENRR